MQMNHHILAKTTTDSILRKFKTEEWRCCNGLGRNFYRVTTDASFPSPDAAFYDSSKKFLVSFEFKPPTETKRGILTGVGQSIAYLKECNISYLIAPERLEDYNLGAFLTDLFQTQIYGKIPAGLILYQNDNPDIVQLICNIPDDFKIKKISGAKANEVSRSRFWAKHQDLPLPLFHLLLHCYYLKKSHIIQEDGFKYCWSNHLISNNILTDFRPIKVYDCTGNVIKTPSGTKDIKFLEKILVDSQKLDLEERRKLISHEIDTDFSGDNMFQSIKKNFTTFMKHLQVIDSEGEITDAGFKLYHLGLTNGPSSKIFKDYFTKEVLTIGHHLDLLLDLDLILRSNPLLTFNKCLSVMEKSYEERGLIKRNPNRKAGGTSKVGFLKYECILWRALGLLKPLKRSHYAVDWKTITEICSLPEL